MKTIGLGQAVSILADIGAIADREGYVEDERNKGLKWGGIGGGILGLLLGFINPLIGLGVLAAGLTAGAVIGTNSGKNQDKVFTRDVNERREVMEEMYGHFGDE